MLAVGFRTSSEGIEDIRDLAVDSDGGGTRTAAGRNVPEMPDCMLGGFEGSL